MHPITLSSTNLIYGKDDNAADPADFSARSAWLAPLPCVYFVIQRNLAMSILGTVVRVRPEHATDVVAELASWPGLDIALNSGDGRLVIILEDTSDTTAAQNMAAIALLPKVLNTSLVYEYSGADVMPADAPASADVNYQSWRTSLGQMAEGTDATKGNPSKT
jgi:nitrate reductase NapD